MIILRCTWKRAESTFWQFRHVLLGSGSSQSWHSGLWSEPKHNCDILKDVIQMIPVTERVFQGWRRFKGCAACVTVCRWTQNKSPPWQTLLRVGFSSLIPRPNKSICRKYMDVFNLLRPPSPVPPPPAQSTGFCNTLTGDDSQSWDPHFLLPRVVLSTLWWIWAMPLLRRRLLFVQRVWLMDGRQWLSPLESKHPFVVSPLKVLLSLLK